MSWQVPQLADCTPGIEPVEYQVLIALAEFSERTSGGILLTEETRDREAFKAATARLVAVSPLAFTYARDEQWQGQAPRVGDVVFVGKYPGDEVEGADGRIYRLCADRQIGAVMERAPDLRPEIEAVKTAIAHAANATAPLAAANSAWTG